MKRNHDRVNRSQMSQDIYVQCTFDMTTSTKVEFKTYDGLTLRGDLYKAPQSGQRPCIIMTNGVCIFLGHYRSFS